MSKCCTVCGSCLQECLCLPNNIEYEDPAVRNPEYPPVRDFLLKTTTGNVVKISANSFNEAVQKVESESNMRVAYEVGSKGVLEATNPDVKGIIRNVFPEPTTMKPLIESDFKSFDGDPRQAEARFHQIGMPLTQNMGVEYHRIGIPITGRMVNETEILKNLSEKEKLFAEALKKIEAEKLVNSERLLQSLRNIVYISEEEITNTFQEGTDLTEYIGPDVAAVLRAEHIVVGPKEMDASVNVASLTVEQIAKMTGRSETWVRGHIDWSPAIGKGDVTQNTDTMIWTRRRLAFKCWADAIQMAIECGFGEESAIQMAYDDAQTQPLTTKDMEMAKNLFDWSTICSTLRKIHG